MPAESHTRELRFELGSPDIQEENGGLIIKNARLLAVGTWTDSMVRIPTYYSPDVLREDATNWIDNSYWSRHSGGAPRSITDKIGVIKNPRFELDAVIGDIILHGCTQVSRDTIAYVKWAQEQNPPIPIYSSVEHFSEDEWNERDRRYEAKSMQFLGAAIVNVGACQSCTLPRANEGDPTNMPDEDPKIKKLEADLNGALDKIKALETADSEKKKELEALKKANEPEPEADPRVTELEGTISAQDAKIKELEAAVKKLEETPDPHGRTISDLPGRELEMPTGVIVNQKTGEIYQA